VAYNRALCSIAKCETDLRANVEIPVGVVIGGDVLELNDGRLGVIVDGYQVPVDDEVDQAALSLQGSCGRRRPGALCNAADGTAFTTHAPIGTQFYNSQPPTPTDLT